MTVTLEPARVFEVAGDGAAATTGATVDLAAPVERAVRMRDDLVVGPADTSGSWLVVVATVAVTVLAMSAIAGVAVSARRDRSRGAVAASPPPPAPNVPTTAAAAPVARTPLTAPVDACATLGASVVDGLSVAELIAGDRPAPWVGVALVGGLARSRRAVGSPPFSIAVVLAGDRGRVAVPAAPVDRAGTTQLWATWDGQALHTAVRQWTAGRWVEATDPTLNVELRGYGARFEWPALDPGRRIGVVTATGGQCEAGTLGDDLQPVEGLPTVPLPRP